METWILDIPATRSHVHSGATVSTQSYLLVRITSDGGAVGHGEVATAGGPWWSGDSIESVKATIDGYLAPLLCGRAVAGLATMMAAMDRKAHGNAFAKAGIEMALLDLWARLLDLPVHVLLGGAQADAFALSWPLGATEAAADLDEAEARLAEGITRFKVKMGGRAEADDLPRALAIARAVAGRAELRIDLNGAWSELQAQRSFAALADAGYRLCEQPLPRHELAGHARLGRRFPITLMADESLSDTRSLLAIEGTDAFSALALKPLKSGGLLATLRLARLAQDLGYSLFGGCFLETSLGTAACLHLGAAIGTLELGCEWMGPRLLRADIVTEPVRYDRGLACLPAGPGYGVEIDDTAIRRFARR
ncbi:muconate/chloromuconate family cycloisomerase [Marinibaculum pumilum]|uniref:Muconate/chloromuconate family cycloisomerase n=1 Tax=Marinibaculum pumilum TaxID=1766165 RepID=A0ABV7L697_9PROT